MKNCNKFLKKMYFGAFLFLCIPIVFTINYFSESVTFFIVFILWFVTMIFVLPYFRCYGDNLRNKRR
jgi:hypothetical protein